jgi:beta-glucosidase
MTTPHSTPPSSGPQAGRPRFLWGAGTSSHQVEGGNDRNDWWEWEQRPGAIQDGARSGPACLHWERYEEDLDLLRALGLNCYRFSLEWSRIEPEAGRYDDGAIEHYRAVLRACRARGITPMVTLHHFTNPRWFAASGGWEEPKNLPHFERFARLAGERYGDLVDDWITVNEPEVLGFYGYASGAWPPGVSDRSRALTVIANLLEAHGLAAHALRAADRTDADGDGRATSIGAAKQWVLLEPKRPWWPLDRLAAAAQHAVFNEAVARALAGGPVDLQIPGSRGVRRTVDALAGASDFLGLNYYTRWKVTLFGKDPRSARRGAPTSDLGWEVYPEGLERAIDAVAPHGLPIVITENGIADAADRLRGDFIRASLASLDHARAAGRDIRGYVHWSLMDNFEWADGHKGRFGLYAVDFAHPEGPRVPRASARVLAEEVARRH